MPPDAATPEDRYASEALVGDLRIGEWVLHPTLNQLSGPAGEAHLEPRTAAVLIDLAQHAGQVRTRDELLDSVWGDRFVGEAVLTHSVWELRRALGDEARNPRYIQTIPRRGYRLVAEVQPLAATVLRTLLLIEGLPQSPIEGASDDRWDRWVKERLQHSDARQRLPTTGALAMGAREDTTLLLFERPVEALRLALDCCIEAHRGADIGNLRCALHLAEIPNGDSVSEIDLESTSEPLFAHRSPLSLATRLLHLARPGQILLTAAAFDLARRSPDGIGAPSNSPGPLRWLAHGGYAVPENEPESGEEGEDPPTETLEVFEVGVEGLSPLRPPATADDARRTHGDGIIRGWRAAKGLPVPQRDHWVLQRKLGEGGFGEVWLAAHGTTGAQRVFKFCYQIDRLRALQREVSLFRLLKETLGERRDIVRILDWNFDTAPYFLEIEHTESGSLPEWAELHGGLLEVPLDTRLEIVAQVADALAAAHSVGVLHKDIKPANILIEDSSGPSLPESVPRDQPADLHARLTDFGIGQVTDHGAFERAGITALGLTAAGATAPIARASNSGTRLYQAPEVIEGKPFTIAADLYALGVMLYQLVVAAPHRALATGWQRDVDDELLRQLIARCVDLDPNQRPSSASDIAHALRTLDARRQRLAAGRQAQEQAEADRQALAVALRRRRRLAAVTALTLAVLLLVSLFALRAHRSRQEAEVARQQAEQRQSQAEHLIGFMLDDLRHKLEDVGQLGILEDVGDQALAYFEAVPEDDWSAEEHLRRAQALRQIGEVRMAQGDLEAALEAFHSSLQQVRAADLPLEAASAPAYLRQIEALHRIGQAQRRAGHLGAADAAFADALEIAEGLAAGAAQLPEPTRPDTSQNATLPPPDLELAGLELANEELTSDIDLALAASLFWVGQQHYDQHELPQTLPYFQRYRQIASSWVRRHPEDSTWRRELAYATSNVGSLLQRQGNFRAALDAHRQSLETHQTLLGRAPDHAPQQFDLAQSHNSVGVVLSALGELSDARGEFQADLDLMQALVDRDPSNSLWLRRLATAHFYLGKCSWQQGDLNEAELLFRQQLRIGRILTRRDPPNAHWRREVAVAQLSLGRVLAWQGRIDSALAHLQEASTSLRQLVDQDSDHRDWRLQLAHTHTALGFANSRSTAALPSSGLLRSHATAALQQLEAVDPPAPTYQAEALLLLGLAHQRAGETPAARAAWGAGRDLLAEPQQIEEIALRTRALLYLQDPKAAALKSTLAAAGYQDPELLLLTNGRLTNG